MTTNIVSNPYGYWPKFSSSGPLFNAKIYVGEPDLDPADIPLNQKQVTAKQEDGTLVAIPQPIETSSGGVTQYQGAPVQITVEGDYSLLVLNNKDEQIYYSSNDKSELEQVSFKPEIVQNQYGDGVQVEFDVPGTVVYEPERYLITWDGGRQWQLANDGIAKNWNITAPGKVTFTSPVPDGVRVDSELYVPITSAPVIGGNEYSHVFNTFNALKTFTGDLSAALRVQTQQHTSEGKGAAFYSKDGTSGIPNSGNEARFYDAAGQGWMLTGTIELSQLGAIPNGVSDSREALENASTVTNICMLDGINGVYHFATTPTLPTGFTSLIVGQNAITGIESQEVNGRLIDGGVLEGIPYTPELGYSKIEIISGTLRQDETDRTQWNWIKDGQHEPLGVDDSVPAAASGSVLTIPFLKSYTKVLSIVAGPDESLANAIGFTCGASIGLGTMEIKASVNQVLSAAIWWDGADWQWGFGPGQGGPGNFGVDISSITFDSANITINHDSINGTDAQVIGYTRDGVVNPLPVDVRNLVLPTKSILSVRDWSGGYTMSESTNMSFIYSKRFAGGIFMDGTNGSESYDLDKGNIWFIGIMAV